MLQQILKTDDEKTPFLIRLMVGSVFLSKGIQKLLYAAQRAGWGALKVWAFRPQNSSETL